MHQMSSGSLSSTAPRNISNIQQQQQQRDRTISQDSLGSGLRLSSANSLISVDSVPLAAAATVAAAAAAGPPARVPFDIEAQQGSSQLLPSQQQQQQQQQQLLPPPLLYQPIPPVTMVFTVVEGAKVTAIQDTVI
jgi:site-specific recombinase XerC